MVEVSKEFTHKFSYVPDPNDKPLEFCLKTYDYRVIEGSDLIRNSRKQKRKQDNWNAIHEDEPLVENGTLDRTSRKHYAKAHYYQMQDQFYWVDFQQEVLILVEKFDQILALDLENRSKTEIRCKYLNPETDEPEDITIICNRIYRPLADRLNSAWNIMNHIFHQMQRRFNFFAEWFAEDGFTAPPTRRTTHYEFKIDFKLLSSKEFVPDSIRAKAKKHNQRLYVIMRAKEVHERLKKLAPKSSTTGVIAFEGDCYKLFPKPKATASKVTEKLTTTCTKLQPSPNPMMPTVLKSSSPEEGASLVSVGSLRDKNYRLRLVTGHLNSAEEEIHFTDCTSEWCGNFDHELIYSRDRDDRVIRIELHQEFIADDLDYLSQGFRVEDSD